MSLKYKSPLIKSRSTSASSTPVNTPHNIESQVQPQSTTYKSPLIKPRNTSTTTSSPVNTAQTIECLARQNSDATPEHGFGRPSFYSPRPRGSPYQWRSPNKFNNSWSSNQNISASYSSEDTSFCHEYRPKSTKFKKQNHCNYPNLNNKNSNEQYYHPSMLEDPWAPLLCSKIKNTE